MHSIHGLVIIDKFLHGSRNNQHEPIKWTKSKLRPCNTIKSIVMVFKNMASKVLPCSMHLLVSSIWQTQQLLTKPHIIYIQVCLYQTKK
jgi:hypothetical protein